MSWSLDVVVVFQANPLQQHRLPQRSTCMLYHATCRYTGFSDKAASVSYCLSFLYRPWRSEIFGNIVYDFSAEKPYFMWMWSLGFGVLLSCQKRRKIRKSHRALLEVMMIHRRVMQTITIFQKQTTRIPNQIRNTGDDLKEIRLIGNAYA
jgi:hypothetical protein